MLFKNGEKVIYSNFSTRAFIVESFKKDNEEYITELLDSKFGEKMTIIWSIEDEEHCPIKNINDLKSKIKDIDYQLSNKGNLLPELKLYNFKNEKEKAEKLLSLLN